MVGVGTTRTKSPHVLLDKVVQEEIDALRAKGELGDGYRVVHQCYVCCEAESRDLVNKLIAAGLTNREIIESCGGINARRKIAGDTRIIGGASLYTHRNEHFNVDKPAQAVLRRIIERRAAEQDRDYINGIGHAVTTYGVLEAIMVKGYAQVADENTQISVKDTILAATKLDELTNRDAAQQGMAEVLVKVDRILRAIREVVPEEYHEAILAHVEGRGTSPTAAIAESVVPAAIKEFTPDVRMDEGDEI